MSVTATTAPTRPKLNQFDVADVKGFKGNSMVIEISIQDANSAPAGSLDVIMRNGTCQSIAYDSNGIPVNSSVLVLASGATNAFNAFANQAGAFGAKAAALLTHLVSVGAIPS